MRIHALFTLVLAMWIPASAGHAIMIRFDRTYDTSGFFNNSTAMAALNAAGAVVGQLLQDDLAAIKPGPSGLGFNNTWEARFLNPSTGQSTVVRDLVVPQDTIIVYVGALNLSSSPGVPLGLNSSGFISTGTPAFNDLVLTRGEGVVSGPFANDYATWGGAISFNSAANWHLNPATNPGAGKSDLFSVALHELVHLLGFGRREILAGQPTRWANLTLGSSFTGAAASAIYGGPVPLDVDLNHWAPNIPSTVHGGGTGQSVALDSAVQTGRRERLTALDVAALSDIGWQVSGAAPLLLGDYNSDQIVNGADFVVWRNSFGSATDLAADGSGNGFVGPEDYDIWLTFFGRSSASGGAFLHGSMTPPTSAVPEPVSMTLAWISIVAAAFILRRHRC